MTRARGGRLLIGAGFAVVALVLYFTRPGSAGETATVAASSGLQSLIVASVS
jgi:hypothetical protein